jgi:hypothetical protein
MYFVLLPAPLIGSEAVAKGRCGGAPQLGAAVGGSAARVQAITFPDLTRLQGVVADGVATFQVLDANGNVLESTPVENNLFASRRAANVDLGFLKAYRGMGSPRDSCYVHCCNRRHCCGDHRGVDRAHVHRSSRWPTTP